MLKFVLKLVENRFFDFNSSGLRDRWGSVYTIRTASTSCVFLQKKIFCYLPAVRKKMEKTDFFQTIGLSLPPLEVYQELAGNDLLVSSYSLCKYKMCFFYFRRLLAFEGRYVKTFKKVHVQEPIFRKKTACPTPSKGILGAGWRQPFSIII